jgi:hypothetical protein
MKKIFAIILAIATVLSFSMIGCSNSSNPITLSKDEIDCDIDKTFSTTNFISEEAKGIFNLISSDTYHYVSGYRLITEYLRNHKFTENEIGQIWELGTNCYLIVNPCRSLYLSNSKKTLNSDLYLLPNVDTYLVSYNLKKLATPSDILPKECIIDDITYLDGQFFYLGELLFDAAYLGPYGKITSYVGNSNEVNQFTGAVDKQIWYITEKDHVFDYSLVLIN